MYRIFDLGYYFCGRLELHEVRSGAIHFNHKTQNSFALTGSPDFLPFDFSKVFGLFYSVVLNLFGCHADYLKSANESRIFDRINRLGQHLNGKHRIGKSECNVSQVTTLDHRSMKKDTLSAVGRTDAVSGNETAKNK